MEVTPRLIEAVNEAAALAQELGARSGNVVGLNTSPTMYSVMLFRRLGTNLRGYMLLWRAELFLEADILLRCIVEATICIAANAKTGDEFVNLVRGDAASTLKGAIKVWRDEGFSELVQGGERHLREVFGHTQEDGSKHAPLDWAALAEQAGHPRLYNLHRMLSGTSAHITGLSLMRGVVGVDGDGEEAARRLDRAGGTVNFASMASVVTLACRLHCKMIGADDLLPSIDEIDGELHAIASAAAQNAG